MDQPVRPLMGRGDCIGRVNDFLMASLKFLCVVAYYRVL